MTEQTVSAPTSGAEEAPWGYKPDGTPYKRDPRGYTGRKRVPAAGKAKATAAAEQTNARAKAVFETLTIPVAGLSILGQSTGNASFVADGIVLADASPGIAMAVAQIADQDARIAGLVDRLVATGPYAALFTAMLPVAMQIAANHSDALAAGLAGLGAKSRDDVLRAAADRAQTAQRAADQSAQAEARAEARAREAGAL